MAEPPVLVEVAKLHRSKTTRPAYRHHKRHHTATGAKKQRKSTPMFKYARLGGQTVAGAIRGTHPVSAHARARPRSYSSVRPVARSCQGSGAARGPPKCGRPDERGTLRQLARYGMPIHVLTIDSCWFMKAHTHYTVHAPSCRTRKAGLLLPAVRIRMHNHGLTRPFLPCSSGFSLRTRSLWPSFSSSRTPESSLRTTSGGWWRSSSRSGWCGRTRRFT